MLIALMVINLVLEVVILGLFIHVLVHNRKVRRKGEKMLEAFRKINEIIGE